MSVKHIADLRTEDGNQRLGVVLQEQEVVEGSAGGVCGRMEELVRSVAFMEDVGDEGSECCDLDEEGWSYI